MTVRAILVDLKYYLKLVLKPIRSLSHWILYWNVGKYPKLKDVAINKMKVFIMVAFTNIETIKKCHQH